MGKHEKMESFFVLRTPTKKINMLSMCNNKSEYVKFVMRKKEILIFFDSRLYFCRYMIINMYHNHMTVLKDQNKNLVLHTEQLYVSKKMMLHKK